MRDNIPPHSLEAEIGVLGAIMMDPDVIHEIAQKLIPDDFYRVAHQTVYRAILDLYARHIRPDSVTVCDALERRGEFKSVGGDDFIFSIAEAVPHAANATYHADIVLQKSIIRGTIQQSTEVIRDGYSNQFTANELLDSAQRKLFAITERHVAGTTIDGRGLAEIFSSQMARRRLGEIIGIDTLFGSIDEIILGMRPGQYIVVGARPSVGKSALGLQIAWNVSNYQGIPALFVSLEMPKEELCDRLVSMHTMIDSRRFRDIAQIEGLSCEESRRIEDAQTDIVRSPLYIDDIASQSLLQISAKARQLRMRNQIGLVVIDYLQYINEKPLRGENTTDKLDRISKGIKNLGRELNIPIIALAQLNRETEKEERKPRMSDLRGCGAIEQDADIIILLHSTMTKEDRTGTVEFLIEKNRNGATGLVPMLFQKEFTRFESMAREGQIRDEARRPPPIGQNRGYINDDGEFEAFNQDRPF